MTERSNMTTDQERDPQLQALFATAPLLSEPDNNFTLAVMQKVEAQKRLRILRRAVIALVIALAAIPLQDYALVFSQLLIISLVDLESGLVAQLLAPINSVGGLLSAMILGLRIAHKKLFH